MVKYTPGIPATLTSILAWYDSGSKVVAFEESGSPISDGVDSVDQYTNVLHPWFLLSVIQEMVLVTRRESVQGEVYIQRSID